MTGKKIVIALGRNSFSGYFPKQKERVALAAKAVADIVEMKNDVVVTHSNGPQVGMIQTAMTEYSRINPSHTVAPMSVCGAMSQGYIGFDLQNAIREELLNRSIYKTVSTVITQVRVDPFDRAFNNPTKVIGRLMTSEEADHERKKGNYVSYEEDENGYRRIIASPKPVDIYEIEAVRTLIDAHQVVIAAGGGGIPVIEQHNCLKGASAVIEKDYTAAKMADMLDADVLLILTSNENLTIREGNEEVALHSLSVKEALKLIDEGHFDPVTSLPKIDASASFAGAKPGRMAVITSLSKAKSGLFGKAGTIIKN